MCTTQRISIFAAILLLALTPHIIQARQRGPITEPHIAWLGDSKRIVFCKDLPEPSRTECVTSYTWYKTQIRIIYNGWYDKTPDYTRDDLKGPSSRPEKWWDSWSGLRRREYKEHEVWAEIDNWLQGTGGYGTSTVRVAMDKEYEHIRHESLKLMMTDQEEKGPLWQWGKRGMPVA